MAALGAFQPSAAAELEQQAAADGGEHVLAATLARRLHREGGRTWPEYCQDRFGESEVNRRIQ